MGVAAGVTASVILVLYLYRFEGFSRLVFAIDTVILSALLIGSRVAVSRLDDSLRYAARTDLRPGTRRLAARVLSALMTCCERPIESRPYWIRR